MGEGEVLSKIASPNQDIVWRNLQGEAVLLNRQNGRYFGLNAVGCAVWEKMDGARTVAEIIQLLLSEYNVPEDVLTMDVLELMDRMHTEGLLHFQ
jgi:hypothetical protein